jgi:hypothetical protein
VGTIAEQVRCAAAAAACHLPRLTRLPCACCVLQLVWIGFNRLRSPTGTDWAWSDLRPVNYLSWTSYYTTLSTTFSTKQCAAIW